MRTNLIYRYGNLSLFLLSMDSCPINLDAHCKYTVGELREVVFHSRKKTILLLELITKTLHVIYKIVMFTAVD